MDHPEPLASRAAFHTALAELQAELTPATTLVQALALLPRHGLSWYLLPVNENDCYILQLCHAEGHEVVSIPGSFADLPPTLAGLIGLPSLLITAADNQTTEADPATEAPPAPPVPEQPAPSPDIDAAAASLADATDGSVIEAEEDPSHSTAPLSEADRATVLEMVKAMSPDQRKAFTIAFRDAFSVSREAKAVAPLITEERHRQFVCRFVNEAEGIAAP